MALENLEHQGYDCYIPVHRVEKMQRGGGVVVADEPLFPRYLFIRLGEGGSQKLEACLLNPWGKPPREFWRRARQGG